ncbi:MAG: DUF1549 and DUF1553 domain-containing protein [Gemmataceae bacterium]|nr:DUF1549 and DUF1553 domain-containing protein [Gemmataceae bacterium]
MHLFRSHRNALLAALVAAIATAIAVPVQADPPKKGQPAEKTVIYPTGYLRSEDWLKVSTAPLARGELDRLVNGQLKKANVEPAPRTTDEQFVRRVWLDLTGRLPMPADVTEFLADKSPNKRARLIDTLLATEDFAKHWSLYWRDVITSKVADQRLNLLTRHFEKWLFEQINANRKWSAITRDLLTATGDVRYADADENGQAFFMVSRRGADAVTELAAETSRIFLGIQIQCAQCHDHPSDVWKRQQFHEFAAYFARSRERPIFEEKKLKGSRVVSLPFGEHAMPDKDNPGKKGRALQPKFIDGKGPRSKGFKGLTDLERRTALADAIVSKQNPWFAGAFVNRMWGELMGQAFYQPIDDLGPEKEAMMPEVLARVAGSFRGSDYDVKGLFRDLMTSETYQRQIRPGESPDEHLLFASRNLARLSANALWMSLVDVLGQLGQPPRGMGALGPFARFAGLEPLFKQEFGFDPSSKAEEVEGSVSQALLLMNNPTINQKIQARGSNLLARILSSYSQDDEAVRMVYLRALARRPTDRELARCREHIRTAGSRAEAFEDILWALINSTEFQTKR